MNAVRAQALAICASLAHVLVDYAIGLYGAGTATPLQAANITAYAAVYAVWGWTIGGAGAARGSVAALVLIAAVWSAFGQGLVGFAACPPPCGGGLGYQDVTHLASLVFGTLAALLTWRDLRASEGRVALTPMVIAIVAMTLSLALQGATFATYGPGSR